MTNETFYDKVVRYAEEALKTIQQNGKNKAKANGLFDFVMLEHPAEAESL